MSLETGDQLIFRHGGSGEHLHRVVERTGAESRPPDQGITYRLRIEDVEESVDLYAALARIQDVVYANALVKDQYDLSLDGKARENEFPKALANIMAELGEAMDDWREGRPIDVFEYGLIGKPEGIPIELADVVIGVLSQCGYHGVDLAAAVKAKVAYNMSRPSKHGKGRV